jgi:hypothetical protein
MCQCPKLRKFLGPKFQKMGINMIEKFLLKWQKVFLNFTKRSLGSTKWQMAKLIKPLHKVWVVGSMVTIWLGEIFNLLWQVCYKIEEDEGNQFGSTSRI